MKKLLTLSFAFFFAFLLSACQTNSFVNDPWKDPVVGQVVNPAVDQIVEPIAEPVEEPAVTDQQEVTNDEVAPGQEPGAGTEPVVEDQGEVTEEPAEEPSEESAEEPAAEQPIAEQQEEASDTPIDCSPVDGVAGQCPEGTMCGTAEWISSEPRIRCLPDNICDANMCANGEECVITETYPAPAQVTCETPSIEPCSTEGQTCGEETINE
jgi:hypothetical protein